ncbi:MAG: DUF1801 domain-containing protein [Pseudomonadota bacterium]
MNKTDKDPDTFLATLDETRRADMIELDKRIVAAMPDATRTLWEGKFWGGTDQHIIGYGDYSYTQSRGKVVEYFINGLALQKNYISVYIHAVENGKYLAETYGKSVGKVKTGKSNISFRSLDDIDIDKLIELIERSYALMRSECS